MTEPPINTYPYTLEVMAHPRVQGTWQWAIRKNDKLVQRSDRALASEAKARRQGMETIEKMRHSGGETRY